MWQGLSVKGEAGKSFPCNSTVIIYTGVFTSFTKSFPRVTDGISDVNHSHESLMGLVT